MDRLIEQFRRHSVALISLVVAVSSLGYNTWRNERTEDNRDVRHAAFEMLLKAGELEKVVFRSHYGPGETRADGDFAVWAYVPTLRDLAMVMPADVGTAANGLFSAWDSHFDALGQSETGRDALSAALDELRGSLLAALNELD